MGGDGREDRAQLGLVPLGTGNDLARTFAIPLRGTGLTPDADVLAAPRHRAQGMRCATTVAPADRSRAVPGR
ncbi:diacylglycerol kinase family protein [Sorangium sp. So ce887]|uniref:diacylglycerol kinase family protein n=1 Tax=Sorangium sp. So ce887 TaxID=3133324 RepID=UPI003F5D789B